MDLNLLASVVLRSFILGALSLVVLAVMRRCAASTRVLFTRLTLVALASLPLLCAKLPHIPIAFWQIAPRLAMPVHPNPAQTITVVPSETTQLMPASAIHIAPGPSIPAVMPGLVSHDKPFVNITQAVPLDILILWIAVSVGVLLPWLARLVGLRRLARTLIPFDHEIAQRERVRLGYANVSVPMTWGWLHRVVAFPIEAEQWSTERIAIALQHELAHIDNRDWIWQRFADVVSAMYWMNPVTWKLASILRDDCEKASDDAVLRSGVSASGYAENLLDIARSLRRGKLAMPVTAIARTSELASRIKAILGNVNRRPLSRRAVVSMITLSVIGATSIAVAVPEPESMNAAIRNAQGVAAKLEVIHRYGDGDPNASDAYFQYAQAQEAAGDVDGAIASYKHCMELPGPTYGTDIKKYAASYEMRDKWLNDAAASSIFRLLEQTGRHRDALAYLQTPACRRNQFMIADWPKWNKQVVDEITREDSSNGFKRVLDSFRTEEQLVYPIGAGESVSLLGMLSIANGVCSAYNVQGQKIGGTPFGRDAGTTAGFDISRTTAGLGPVNNIVFVVKVQHDLAQGVCLGIFAKPEPNPQWWPEGGDGEGCPLANGKLLTSEEQIHPQTNGLRLISTSMPTEAKSYSLQIGVYDVPQPYDLSRAPLSPDLGSSDNPGTAYRWATFNGIIAPIPPRPGTHSASSSSSTVTPGGI